MFSHRSGETEDTTIADLAVATELGSDQDAARPPAASASRSTISFCASRKSWATRRSSPAARRSRASPRRTVFSSRTAPQPARDRGSRGRHDGSPFSCPAAPATRPATRRRPGLARRHPPLGLHGDHDGPGRARGVRARPDDRHVRRPAPADRRARRPPSRSARTRSPTCEAQRDRWTDPAYITTQARERLYYVKPGEVVYLVDDDLPPALAPQEQATGRATTSSRRAPTGCRSSSAR